MVDVKVCGLRTLEDAVHAATAGAWALGFIFHRPSPRYIEPAAVADITSALRSRGVDVLKVGVFVDLPLEELNEIVATAGLDARATARTRKSGVCARRRCRPSDQGVSRR